MEKIDKLDALHMVNQMFIDSLNELTMLHNRLGGKNVDEFTQAENELSESYEWILNDMDISRDDERYYDYIIKEYNPLHYITLPTEK